MSGNFIEENAELITLRAMTNVFVNEGMDPVGKEDGDVDNDGDKDSSDKYLLKRRKAIGDAIKRKKKVTESVVATTDEDDKEVTEKNVKNKVVINPEMKEGYDKPDEKLKTDRDMFNVPKDEQKAARKRILAKALAKRKEKGIKEATYPSDFRNPDGSKRAVAKKKYDMPKQHDEPTRGGRRKTVDE